MIRRGIKSLGPNLGALIDGCCGDLTILELFATGVVVVVIVVGDEDAEGSIVLLTLGESPGTRDSALTTEASTTRVILGVAVVVCSPPSIIELKRWFKLMCADVVCYMQFSHPLLGRVVKNRG